MAKAKFIDPREAGVRQFDLKQPVFDADAISRADETMKAMSASFEKWLDADAQALQSARSAAEANGWSDGALQTLMRAAHDLKGMGGAYGYPLVTDIAASLCRLIETDAGKAAARANPDLVCAHVDALRASIRDRITSDAHPVGRALVQALETRVAALGVAPR